MHLTERDPNKCKAEQQTPKWWCDVIFQALINGCGSYPSWNLLLDTDGQPLTGKYPCGGFEEIDTQTGDIHQSTPSVVFRQMGPYAMPGAQILELPQPDSDLSSIAFRNPDGKYVVIKASILLSLCR